MHRRALAGAFHKAVEGTACCAAVDATAFGHNNWEVRHKAWEACLVAAAFVEAEVTDLRFATLRLEQLLGPLAIHLPK